MRAARSRWRWWWCVAPRSPRCPTCRWLKPIERRRRLLQDVLPGKQELEVPAEGTDARRELGNLAEPDRHAALVVGVEAHAAHAGGVERRDVVVFDLDVHCDYTAGAVGRLRIERGHGVEDRRIVGAVYRGLREYHALDAER